MAVIPIYEGNEQLFRRQLNALLEASGIGVGGTFSAVQLFPITTAQKNALANSAGLLVYDTTLGKLCINTGAGWETVTSV
jgi:hypothetical protein